MSNQPDMHHTHTIDITHQPQVPVTAVTQQQFEQQAIWQQLVAQLLETLTLVPYQDNVFIGQSYDYVGARIFGGQVLGQALMAASHTVEHSKPCHSFHSYFLRGGDINKPEIGRAHV